jgi:enamine deaminase RidA (YjgF/YER057c/UK114 family)
LPQTSKYQINGSISEDVKCTPKFARAKLLSNGESKQVFISGTASIREQVTIGEDDVDQQKEITLGNIQNLVSSNTLSHIEITKNELPEIKFIRVYIKFPEDYTRVMEICEKKLPSVPSIYVVSDVCREDLLVEIEALATY